MATRTAKPIDVYLEIGKKRTFAGAIDWPGWCRSGGDEEAALQALFDYGPRYARILRLARLGFHAPKDVASFTVVERHKGDATTDFGATSIVLDSDTKSLSDAQVRRLQKVLKACWKTFDATVEAATGKSLRKGPRGGGRAMEGIVEHLLESDASYLGALGWKLDRDDKADLPQQLAQTRQATLDAMVAVAKGEIPARGPRGGTRWTLPYFVRRSAWHVVDHIWEIEDRSE